MHGFKPIDIVGVVGGLLVLFAFFRISVGRWRTSSIKYELDNFIGATLLSIYAYEKHAYVSIVLNAIWATVAFRGVSSYTERKMKRVVKKETRKIRHAKSTKPIRRLFSS